MSWLCALLGVGLNFHLFLREESNTSLDFLFDAEETEEDRASLFLSSESDVASSDSIPFLSLMYSASPPLLASDALLFLAYTCSATSCSSSVVVPKCSKGVTKSPETPVV